MTSLKQVIGVAIEEKFLAPSPICLWGNLRKDSNIVDFNIHLFHSLTAYFISHGKVIGYDWTR